MPSINKIGTKFSNGILAKIVDIDFRFLDETETDIKNRESTQSQNQTIKIIVEVTNVFRLYLIDSVMTNEATGISSITTTLLLC